MHLAMSATITSLSQSSVRARRAGTVRVRPLLCIAATRLRRRANYARCFVLALALAAPCSSVRAQTTSPTDTDLRAAYCAESDKRDIAGLEATGEFKLSAYVAGRRPHIDPTLMLAAARSADADFDGGQQALARGDMGAFKAATDRAFDRCYDLSWFPF
jgi:hypothetical protein